MEYFGKIDSVVVKYKDEDVVYYDVDKNAISYPRYIKNIVASKYTVKIVNNFLGEERIKLPKKLNRYSHSQIDEMLGSLSEQELYTDYGIIL